MFYKTYKLLLVAHIPWQLSEPGQPQNKSVNTLPGPGALRLTRGGSDKDARRQEVVTTK